MIIPYHAVNISLFKSYLAERDSIDHRSTVFMESSFFIINRFVFTIITTF